MELAGVTTVTRENLDEVWAAMLALPDGAALAREAKHLDWQMPPRGRENTDLVERFGADVLPWIRTRITDDGVLLNQPWCVVPCLMALDDPRALELLLDVDAALADGGDMARWEHTPPQGRGDAAQALALVLEWTRRHPEVAERVLEASTLPRAAEAKAILARKRSLAPDDMLALLDAGAIDNWPRFHTYVDGRMEYFGLRVIGIRSRSGAGWAVVLERLQGCDPDSFAIWRYAYGPSAANGWIFENMQSLEDELELIGDDDQGVFRGMTAKGKAGSLLLDESLFARFDLRPNLVTEEGGWAARTLAHRAYLAAFPDAAWPPVDDAIPASGIADGEVIVATRAFFHVEGPPREGDEPKPSNLLPSESPTYRSLIDAIIARDASRFVPGESNTDWRLHAIFADDFVLPWRQPLPALANVRGLGDGADLTRHVRGDGRYLDDVWVWDLDRTWAALCALPVADAAKAFAAMDFVDPPRDPTSLIAAFGDATATVLKARIGEWPAWQREILLAMDSPAAFALAWDLPDRWGTEVFTAWMTAHPATGYGALARLAATGDKVAREYLVAWGRPQVRRVLGYATAALGADAARALFVEVGLPPDLSAQQILDLLDNHAKRAGDAWPAFVTGAGPSREYHGLRMIAARAGERWLIVLERAEGYGRNAAIRRYVYADDLPTGLTPAYDAELDEPRAAEEPAVLIETPDYWTGPDRAAHRIAAIRAQPIAWPDPAPLLAELGFGAPLIVSTAFAHDLASTAYRSLAEAIVANDPTRFAPGASNLAVSLHLRM